MNKVKLALVGRGGGALFAATTIVITINTLYIIEEHSIKIYTLKNMP